MGHECICSLYIFTHTHTHTIISLCDGGPTAAERRDFTLAWEGEEVEGEETGEGGLADQWDILAPESRRREGGMLEGCRRLILYSSLSPSLLHYYILILLLRILSHCLIFFPYGALSLSLSLSLSLWRHA